ncbi:hypothetical protein K438DRAFT_594392 [Mycena galopus ATCC 62051]|nr:hypothetical protein K438DRAFT_594392 [Mycena galopus ATCC 62051]
MPCGRACSLPKRLLRRCSLPRGSCQPRVRGRSWLGRATPQKNPVKEFFCMYSFDRCRKGRRAPLSRALHRFLSVPRSPVHSDLWAGRNVRPGFNPLGRVGRRAVWGFDTMLGGRTPWTLRHHKEVGVTFCLTRRPLDLVGFRTHGMEIGN